MKKVLSLSLITTAILLNASEVNTLETINVFEKVNTKIVKNISKEEIKSADLAESLSKNIPSISIVRRSGIANDIILRGQKKDNINVIIDNAKIYGACPNRMDPVTSHVLTNNIESIEVIEGPYDVENFGTLSGKVKINTKKPTKKVSGEVNLNAGSFGYKKASATVSGGTDKFKLLISASVEKGDQYKDGNGNDFLEQQVEKNVPASKRYSKSDLEAFEKKTLLSKAIINVNDDAEIDLSYTANRSDNVLYPNTPMDADYDDSNIYTIAYTHRNLSDFSKELKLDYYYSNVDHPMSVRLRNNAMMMKDMTNHMKSSIWGTKIKNTLDVSDTLLTFGLDTSTRNWRGQKYNNDLSVNKVSLSSTDTVNKAVFAKVEKTFDKLDITFASRYDYTDVDTADILKNDNKYTSLNANVFAVYNQDKKTKYFAGIGKASRVPDARELYYGTFNNDLEQTTNYELDLGFEKTVGDFYMKTKVFYSVLKDYIYSNNGTSFENVDAKIYGLDISGFYYINDNFSMDYGLSYQRGNKDESLAGQSDKDLAEIPPLKTNVSFNYEYQTNKLSAQIVAVDKWNNIDSDNGEQELAGYTLVNLKYKKQVYKNFDIIIGVDNVFDKNYISTNTYKDITYLETSGDRTLLNDPGRYFFTNLRFTF